MNIFKNISIINKFIKIFDSDKDVNLSGFSDSEKSILIYETNRRLNRKAIIVASDLISASNLENMLLSFNLKVYVLKETLKVEEKEDWQNLEKREAKQREISKIVLDFCENGDVLIVLPNCLNQNVCAFKESLNSNLEVKIGDNLSRESMTKRLLELGLSKTATTPEKNEFQFLGDILNIAIDNKVYKIDFFDEEVEGIKENGEKVELIKLSAGLLNFQGNENLFLNILESYYRVMFR